MRKTLPFALVGALAATAACTTNNTTTTSATPSANAVIPAAGFIGRQLRVEISGDNTGWTSATTVDFGAGVTVGSVTVSSPTDIFADITIDPTAAPGMRDVKVSDTATGDVTLMQAFELDNPVALDIQGTVAQGSIALFTLTNHDFDNPFDATSTGDGLTSPIVFTNLTVNSPTGVAFNISNVTAYSATGTVLFDTNAAPGAVSIDSGPAGGTIVSSPTGMLAVAARTATVLAAGTPMSATVAKAFDSKLYEFDAAAPASGMAALISLTATTTSSTAAPEVFVLPASGAWADEVGEGATVNQVESAATKFYLVALDPTGAQGFQYAVGATTLNVNVLNEVEPNNTIATAQTATALPVLFTTAAGAATLTDATDIDFIKITVPAGKKVHVVTLPGDAQCDSVVDVETAAGVTLGGPSSDADYQEDFVSTAVPSAGTYVVKIYASDAGFFDPTQNHYQALITLE